ncbi:diguanylate cyclase [Reinekea blandensis]|uniref:diguanylate cyclase n=1 Tax=Reinekea blandensis TaxID=374838 RepID=UPI0002E3FAE5|nr:diguanylate cyclase [Reinekea blandensis]
MTALTYDRKADDSMQTFSHISLDWVSAIKAGRFDIPFQSVETNCCNALADIAQALSDDAGVQVFSFEYIPGSVSDPYELFYRILNWYEQQYGEAVIDQLIEDCCYVYHQDLVKAWYLKDHLYRDEPLLFDQASYEEQEFLSGIERILDRLSQRRPFLVLISQIDLAPDIMQQAFIRWMQDKPQPRGWGIVGFIRQARRLRRLQGQPSWQECLRILERQELIFPFDVTPDQMNASYSWHRPAPIKGYRNLYRMLISAADTFAYSDVIRIVQLVQPRYAEQKAGQLLFLSAYSSLMMQDLDEAIQKFTRAQDMLQSTNNEGILTGSYYWLSVCFTLRAQEKWAREAQEQCEKLALEYEDPRWYALSQFAGYYIDSHLTQHRLTPSNLRSLRYLLSEQSFDNMLALTFTQIYSNQGFDAETSSRDYLRNCVSALRIFRQAGNHMGVSIALHAMGVVYMRLGNVRQTERLYELSLSIRDQYQSKADLVPMLNALGYFLIGKEDWQKAWTLFDRALGLLIENRNFNEASVTLYNFIWLYTQSGSINQALELMNDLLELMRIRDIESVPFRNLKDLCVLKGWLHILLRQPVQARYCLVRMQGYSHLHETSFTGVLRDVLEARLALSDGEQALALRETQKAQRRVSHAHDLDLYMETSLRLEIARLFVDLGHKEKALPIFTELRHKAHRHQLDTLAQRVSRASLGINYLAETTLPAMSQPYQVLLDIAQKETQLLSLQNELSQYHQINLLMEMSAESDSVDRFLQQVIDVLDRRIPANEFAVLLTGTSDYPVHSAYTNDVPANRIRQWQSRLPVTNRHQQSFTLNDEECLALPLKTEALEQGWLLLSGDAQQRQVWNVNFLGLFAQQLGLILDRRLREAYLEHRNKTDLLTGLLNRAGLFERLKKLFAQLRRDTEQPFALCFFDLDHFKYFNDHFGHDLGDGVLKALADQVNTQLRGTDELCRLGGDEFILLLPKTDRASAEALVERLRTTLAKPDWWLSLLIDSTSSDANPVPRNEWITASFGVVVLDRWPPDGVSRIDLLAQGDAAMYQAKKQGKNRVVVVDYDASGCSESD